MNQNIFLEFRPTFVLVLMLGLALSCFAQTNPNYSERYFQITSQSINKSVFGTGEASIDPNEYKVGPGENIFISISGIEEINLDLFVSIENYLFIPKVGGVNLKDLSLAQAKEKIKATLEKYYKDVEIFITLGNLKKNKIFIVGDVLNPKSLMIESNTRLFDVLLDTVTFNKTSNFRDIQIKNSAGIIKHCDFLSFLRNGDKTDNPLLNDGDVIFIDKADRLVTISGAVKYPATYEFLEGETINDLINLAGGFQFDAKTDSIELVRFDAAAIRQESYFFSYQEIVEKNIPLNMKDNIIVRVIPEYYIDNFVTLEGWIRFPGVYRIEKDKTKLSDLIAQAGGFRTGASVRDATLIRAEGESEVDPEYERLKTIPRADMTDDEYDYLKAKSRQRKGIVVVDFEELFVNKNFNEDVVLKRGDDIKVPEAKNYVILLGQVVNPGNIIYNPNYTVGDYIQQAGGFGWRAIESDVRIIKSGTGEWIDDEDVDSIDPGDTIWIPEEPPGPKFWDIFTTSLQVLGQVAAVIAATVAVIIATR